MSEPSKHDHFRRCTSAIFTPSGGDRTPVWLRRRATECSAHYTGISLAQEFETALAQFETHAEEPFEVFVVGEGNFGKSTLVNALLGQAISKVDFRPETRTFMRYILRSQPSLTARLFVRIDPAQHGWIIDRIGEGKPCEIFNALEYILPRSVADEILDADVERCRIAEKHNALEKKRVERAKRTGETCEPQFDRYTPAILEIERELSRTPHAMFAEGVRLVDTQGLNQLFDDDLLQEPTSERLTTSVEVFEEWMRNSPRGRHLDWQFRRCDAVLWLLHASVPGAGPSLAAMNYFRKYGKKTVVAITQIDKVGEAAKVRVIADITGRVGQFASSIVPVNGKLAMESSVSNDRDGIERSGLAKLVNEIRSACLNDAARVRSISQYISLRTTETQLRSALQKTVSELETLQRRLADDRQQIAQGCLKIEGEMRSKLEVGAKKQLAFILNNVTSLTLTDNDATAPAIIQANLAADNFINAVRASCLVADSQIERITEELSSQEYSLPAFDADGKRHGSSVRVTNTTRLLPIMASTLNLHLKLESEIWDSLKLWMKRTVLGFFSSTARDEADREERLMNAKRHSEVAQQVKEQWVTFTKSSTAEVESKIAAAQSEMETALERIEAELEKLHGERLRQTQKRVNQLLERRYVSSPYVAVLLSGLRSVAKRRAPSSAHA
jgi:GTP-binding protein EngB required for normal cell division